MPIAYLTTTVAKTAVNITILLHKCLFKHLAIPLRNETPAMTASDSFAIISSYATTTDRTAMRCLAGIVVSPCKLCDSFAMRTNYIRKMSHTQDALSTPPTLAS